MMIGRTDTHAPCFGCDKRTIDCHADCEAYKTWSAEHLAARGKLKQEARKNGAAYLVRQESYYRNRRKRHRSGGKTRKPRKR